jgi:hypothetical protein
MNTDAAIKTCRRPCLKAVSAALLMAALAVAGSAEAQTQEVKKSGKLRRYADGPLTVEDFAGKPPERSPIKLGIDMVANTECQVQYDYRAAIEQRGLNQWTARVTRFTCVAVVDPEKCWLTWRDNRRVLDHEQGHFDLAELAARRAQQHFAGLIRDKKALASGRDPRAAERELDAEIKKTMEQVYQSLDKAQKTYDEETLHGTSVFAQRRQRDG